MSKNPPDIGDIKTVNLSDVIGKSFYNVFLDLEAKNNIHYVFKGGRGSLKSSFVFLYVIFALTRDAMEGKSTHCVAMRKVKDTIFDSLYQNFVWAIDLLNLSDYWTGTVSPMKLKCGENTILFRGCANKRDFEKIKSIKFKGGFCKYAIFEETTEFSGMDEIRQILASLLRGGNEGFAFYMYNPPPSKKNWCNEEFDDTNKIPGRYIHQSTYLTAPEKWLGKIFLDEAKRLRLVNPRKYLHMYIGKVMGEGLEIYENVNIRPITKEEIKNFTKIYRGVDFGFTKDASCYLECYFDEVNDKLYIFDEVYGHRMSNKTLYANIYPKSSFMIMRGDSAEPRTINELKILGLNIIGAKKGKDSKDHGIKWLSDLAEIIIDKDRCPFTAYDFESYEYEKDKDGNIIKEYPKEPHASAAARYALSEIIRQNKIQYGGRRK